MTADKELKTDFFGMGAALQGAVRIFFHSARRSGRTNSLLEALKKGDRVVFATDKEARHFERLAKLRGKEIEVFVCPPHRAEELFRTHGCRGNLIFEHTWLEQFYEGALQRAEKDVVRWETELSGWPEPPEETPYKKHEIGKWSAIV